jgi:hypothetical protein
LLKLYSPQAVKTICSEGWIMSQPHDFKVTTELIADKIAAISLERRFESHEKIRLQREAWITNEAKRIQKIILWSLECGNFSQVFYYQIPIHEDVVQFLRQQARIDVILIGHEIDIENSYRYTYAFKVMDAEFMQ